MALRLDSGSPSEEDPDVPRHAAWKVHDLRPGVEALRLQLRLEEHHGALGEPGQGLGPVGREVVDRAPAVDAELARKAQRQDSRSPRSAAPRTRAETRFSTSG